jgi:hypothetical protein
MPARALPVAQLGMQQDLQNRNRTSQNWAGLGSSLGILAGLALGGMKSGKGDSIGSGGLLDILGGN